VSQLIAYIHLNPVSGGLASDPTEWPWTGHLEVLGRQDDPIVDVASVLSLYGSSRRAAVRGYVKSLKGHRACDWQGEQPGRLPWWPASPDRPVDVPAPSAVIDERGVSTGLNRPQLRPERFFELACRALGADPKALKTASRSRQLSRQRQLIVGLGAERWSQRTRDLAAIMYRTSDTGTVWVRRCIEWRLSEPGFAHAYLELDAAVAAAAEDG